MPNHPARRRTNRSLLSYARPIIEAFLRLSARYLGLHLDQTPALQYAPVRVQSRRAYRARKR